MMEKALLPEFPGGEEGFNAYISRHLSYKGTSLENDNRSSQKLSFSFMLDEYGHVYDIYLNDYTNADLDKLIRDILEKMPAWKMKGYKKWGPITKNYTIH